MKIQLPVDVKIIVDTIQNAGYEAYVVGGCVRDSILMREPDDWDITTSAKPEEVKKIFRKTVDTGLIHGTVTVLFHGVGYEVTTYRIDGEYEDSRHPKEVKFTANLLEDLKRRDFTINAMAYNETVGLVDAFGGMDDIKNKVIRAVGDPRERFKEDALRMMRAIRFSAQLNYHLEEETKRAIIELSPTIANISAERIQVEFLKLVVSDHPEKVRELYEAGISKIIMPEFDKIMNTEQNNPHHSFSVGEHTIKSMLEVQADKVLRLSMFFHDFGKADTMTEDENGIHHFYGHPERSEKLVLEILKRLKFDNDTITKVAKIVKYHDFHPETNKKAVRKAIHKIGEDIMLYLFDVNRADILAQSDYGRAAKLQKLEETIRLYHEIIEEGQCVSLKTLAVTGKDLIEAGITPGKEIGVVLANLLEYVLEHPEKNQKDELLRYLDTIQK